jgi:ankyrin repeat protein
MGALYRYVPIWDSTYAPSRQLEYKLLDALKEGADVRKLRELFAKTDCKSLNEAKNNFTEYEINKAFEYCAKNNLLPQLKYLGHWRKNRSNYYAILSAVENGHASIIEYFVKETGFEPANTWVDVAAENGHINLVEYFINLGCDPTHTKNSPLKKSIKGGHVILIRYLIENCGCKPIEDDKVIEECAKFGNLGILKYLEQQGFRSQDGYVLDHAAENGHIDIVEYLIEKGCSPDISSLALATRRGHTDIVKYFINLGMDPRHDNDYVLTEAIESNNLELVKYLLSLGCDPRCESDIGLFIAIEHGYLELTMLLFNLGCQIRKQEFNTLDVALFHRELSVYYYVLMIMPKKEKYDYITNAQNNEKDLSTINEKLILDQTCKKNVLLKKILRPTSQHIQLIFI